MKLKLLMNELGLLRTEDGKWGLRQTNEHTWVVQYRENPNDPWDWQVVEYFKTREEAVAYITTGGIGGL